MLDAIDREDHAALRGEIGDLLFEGVFLAQLEADEGRFTVSDSLREVTAKLIRRHPHVFGSAKGVNHTGQSARAVGADQVAREEAGRASHVSPPRHAEGPSLPAGRARNRHPRRRRRLRLGQDEDVVAKIEEEVAELKQAIDGGGPGAGGGRDGRLAVRDCQSGPEARRRTGVSAAQGQSEVQRPASRRSNAASKRPAARCTMRAWRRWKRSGRA